MNDPDAPLPDGVDRSALERVFRRATGLEGGRLIGWRCRRLGTPRVASTRAVYRFDDALAVGAERVAAALALKVLSPGADGALPREAELYRLGYLAQLTLGLGLLEVQPVLRLVRDGRQRAWAQDWYGRPLEEILVLRASIAEFLLELGRGAVALARAPAAPERAEWP